MSAVTLFVPCISKIIFKCFDQNTVVFIMGQDLMQCNEDWEINK